MTLEELQPAIDAALARDGAIVQEPIRDGMRYSTVGGDTIGVVEDVAALREANAAAELDESKLIKAIVIRHMEVRLGRLPTADELRAERARIARIYGNL